MRAKITLMLTAALSAVIALGQSVHDTIPGSGPFQSPPGPPSSPLPTATPQSAPSEAARKALAYIAGRKGIPSQALIVADDYSTEYPALGREFQVVTLLDTRPEGQIYKLLVDLADGRIEENLSSLQAAEAKSNQSRYGKLQPALYERVQTLRDEAMLPVAVWMTVQPGQTSAELQEAAFAVLAAKYPEAKAALDRSGKPMDVSDPELARRIEAEYVALLDAGVKARTEPLVTELKQRGFTVTTYEGMPSFTAILPKRVILELSQREDVGTIFLIEAEAQPSLDSAIPTSLAPIVWNRGYNGSGETIAILEHGNVDTANTYLHHAATYRVANNGAQDHTTVVASAAASFHSTYRGTAPGASVVSAGHNGNQSDAISALEWAFDQGARIVNISEFWEVDDNVNWIDYAFDHWARLRFRFITVAPGNSGGSLGSPGKAWNIVTVGSIDDNNNADWSDDQMRSDSPYINPGGVISDREKPEIVAVGGSVTALAKANNVQTSSGTSLAAPQVAGLAALLMDRNPDLRIWPEAAKAIIMASATHNIEGFPIIVRGYGDLRDGAGAINAGLADTAAQTRAQPATTCYVSCWWGEYVDNNNLPVGTSLQRSFYAEKDDIVRVAVSWWANADGSNYTYGILDTDLDLNVTAPPGNPFYGYVSLSRDNNYEIVQFVSPRTGQHTISVYKYRADEPRTIWV
jgi:hypothetical protein